MKWPTCSDESEQASNGAVVLNIQYLTNEASDIAVLQSLFESSPAYSEIATGMPVAATAASEMISALPKGKTFEDKFAIGFFEDGCLVACADLIRGYPKYDTAFIGLLPVAQSRERQGHGAEAFECLRRIVENWGTCTTLRLGIIETNHKAKRFWLNRGFVPTGEVNTYDFGKFKHQVGFYEQNLAAGRAPR